MGKPAVEMVVDLDRRYDIYKNSTNLHLILVLPAHLLEGRVQIAENGESRFVPGLDVRR